LVPKSAKLDETAPEDQEEWVRANKKKFVEQYGKTKGLEILYATAWKRHNARQGVSEGKKQPGEPSDSPVAKQYMIVDRTGKPISKPYKSEKVAKNILLKGKESGKYKKSFKVVCESSNLVLANSTLDHILKKFGHEIGKFKDSGELDGHLYIALFDYYQHAGDMPYGIAHSKDGDPHSWVGDKLTQELTSRGEMYSDIHPYDGDVQFEAWTKQFNELLSEGMSISSNTVSNSDPNYGGTTPSKTITVTATDEDADTLADMIKHAGIGMFGDIEDDLPDEVEVAVEGDCEPQVDEDVACESCGKCECECEVTEGTETVNGHDEEITQDSDYMLNTISGGLNNKKLQHKHGYKQGDNPLAMDELAEMRKLSGIKI